MKKLIGLMGVLLTAFLLNACQTTDIIPETTTEVIANHAPVHTAPVDVLNSFIALQAITP